MSVLVFIDTRGEKVAKAALEALTYGRKVAEASGQDITLTAVDLAAGPTVNAAPAGLAASLGNIDTAHQKAELGWTRITPKWQLTAINTDAKLLMLKHAFETWNCIRVELKTDANNDRSRNAMLRIGCTEEGTLRNHMITESGRLRDSVYFSIIQTEWESVKQNLTSKLAAN